MAAPKKLTRDEINQRARLAETFAEQVEKALREVIEETPARLLSADDGTPYTEGDDLDNMVERAVEAVKASLFGWL